MSIPRDLKVKIPGGGHGQDQRRLRDRRPAQDRRDDQDACSRTRRARTSRSTTSSASSFGGFRRAVNYVGGVYVDVDRRYYNDNTTAAPGRGLRDDRRAARLPEAQGPGRARLRPLPPRRQRLLPRLAPAGLPAPDLAPGRASAQLLDVSKRKELAHIFGRYFEVDKSFVKASNLIGAGQDSASTGAARRRRSTRSASRPTRPRTRRSTATSTSRTPTLRKTVDEFMTGKGSSNPRQLDDDDQADATPTAAAEPKPSARTSRPRSRASSRRATEGENMAVLAESQGKLGFPFYFPGAAQDRLALRRHQAAHLRHPRRPEQAAQGLPARALRGRATASTTASRA